MGGKINRSALFELYGTAGKENDPAIKKKVESERRPRFTWVSDQNGMSIDQIAHRLWEDNNDMLPGIESSDYRDAVNEVIGTYSSTQAMALDLIRESGENAIDDADIPVEELKQEAVEEKKRFDESEDIIVDEAIFEITNREFLNNDCTINWEALSLIVEKSEGFFTSFPYELTTAQFNNLKHIINDESEREKYDRAERQRNQRPGTQEDNRNDTPDSSSEEQNPVGSSRGTGSESETTQAEPAQPTEREQRIAQQKAKVSGINDKLKQAQIQLDKFNKSLSKEEGKGQLDLMNKGYAKGDELIQFDETPAERQEIANKVLTAQREVNSLYKEKITEEKQLFELESVSEGQTSIESEEEIIRIFEDSENSVAYESDQVRQNAVQDAVRRTEELPEFNRRDESSSLFPLVQKRTVLEGFKESGEVSFVGQRIGSPQDIADLWSIHRSPYIVSIHAPTGGATVVQLS